MHITPLSRNYRVQKQSGYYLEKKMLIHCNVINIITLSSSHDISVPFKQWNVCHLWYADSHLAVHKQIQEFSPLNNYNLETLTALLKLL